MGKRRIPIQNLLERLEPGQFLAGQVAPKLVGRLFGLLPQFQVGFHAGDVGLRGE